MSERNHAPPAPPQTASNIVSAPRRPLNQPPAVDGVKEVTQAGAENG